MHSKYYIFLIFAIFGPMCRVAAQCQLSTQQVEGEKRIFAVNDGSGALRLMREDTVAEGAAIYLICSVTDVVVATCQRNGQLDVTVPTNSCDKPIKATVEKLTDAIDGTCQSDGQLTDCDKPSKATMGKQTNLISTCDIYRVGFNYGNHFLELYRTCYNVAELKAYFSREMAYQYSLVTSRPDAQFTTDRIITAADAATFQSDNIFERFELLLGANQRYIKNGKDYVIHRGHLTPSADFLFSDGMRATFKYINVVPQFGSINIGNWKSIETWLRNHLQSSGQKQAEVYTGGIDVLQLSSTNGTMVPMYLATNNRNPIPKCTYKIVLDNSIRIAFITYNNIYDDKPLAAICATVTCPVSLTNSKTSGFTYCCNGDDFIKQIPLNVC